MMQNQTSHNIHYRSKTTCWEDNCRSCSCSWKRQGLKMICCGNSWPKARTVVQDRSWAVITTTHVSTATTGPPDPKDHLTHSTKSPAYTRTTDILTLVNQGPDYHETIRWAHRGEVIAAGGTAETGHIEAVIHVWATAGTIERAQRQFTLGQ